MEFHDNTKQNKKRVISSVSKSRLAAFSKCPQRAWLALRDTERSLENNRFLDIGILAHELAAEKVYELAGKEYNLESIEARFPETIIYAVKTEIEGKVNFERLLKNQHILEIEQSFSIEMEMIEKDFRLIVKPDLITYRDIHGKPFINVYDWKTGFNMSTEVDTEAMIYAYAAFKKYGINIIFTRVNIKSGKIWSHEFTTENLMLMEPILIPLIKRFKKNMESGMVPEFKPGSHCSTCKYITKCDGRKYISSLRHKYKAAIWAKELAKKYENDVKSAAAEILSATQLPDLPEREKEYVLLPFLNGEFGAIAETSKSYQLASRKIKKIDIIKALMQANMLETVVDQLDLKFNEEVSEFLSQTFKIPMKEVVRTTIKLVAKGGEEEGENNEEA